MKKVSRIMLLVSGIYSFVFAGVLFISGIVCLIVGLVAGPYVAQEDETVYLAFLISMIVSAVICLIIAGLCLASGLISLKARKTYRKPMLITTIVFGTIIDNPFAIVGAVLGLIANARNME